MKYLVFLVYLLWRYEQKKNVISFFIILFFWISWSCKTGPTRNLETLPHILHSSLFENDFKKRKLWRNNIHCKVNRTQSDRSKRWFETKQDNTQLEPANLAKNEKQWNSVHVGVKRKTVNSLWISHRFFILFTLWSFPCR